MSFTDILKASGEMFQVFSMWQDYEHISKLYLELSKVYIHKGSWPIYSSNNFLNHMKYYKELIMDIYTCIEY